MKIVLFCLSLLLFSSSLFSKDLMVKGPSGDLELNITLEEGEPLYSVTYDKKVLVEKSPLGLICDVGNFSESMSFVSSKENVIDESYSMNRAKTSLVDYVAKEVIYTMKNVEGKQISIVFRVSDNDIAFKYVMPQFGETASCVVEGETTGFKFPDHATTFITPQATPMIGWKRTKPSYEEEYVPDEPIGTPSKYGEGYTFPALFHVGDDGWVLVSETGVSSSYCASHLNDGTADGLYTIAYPNPKENNGNGTSSPGLSLPGETPWRTITVGNTLKPIVETTVPFDVVEQLYEPSQEYKFGRSTWSWIMWQDNSINYDDQIKYIDLAADMGYEYVLIDGHWENQIGYEKMPSLFKYAQSKDVDPFVWYNSNGYWNDAPQRAKQKMHNSIVRKKEMEWLKDHGVKGIKVDFFGGDKQETMKLYEDILSDANDYGLMVIFHGCTLPRGWERMYPNFVGSEAVLASENLVFTQKANDDEAYNATLHPFIRNTVGSMEFGPVLLNKRHNRTNDGGSIRRTSFTFQLATAVLFQSPVQMFAIAPNNLEDSPKAAIDFMKEVPTTWDEVQYIDGYPGKYCVIARRHADKWYVAGINATKEPLKLKVSLPMFENKKVYKYADDAEGNTKLEKVSINKKGNTTLTIVTDGGVILTN